MDEFGLIARYFAPLAFPDTATVGLRVAHIGTSSVRYELAIFRNEEDEACAQGHFVHVYVNRVTNRPVPLPPASSQRLICRIARSTSGSR